MNGLIAGLQQKDLIERVPSATHGRIIEIRLSATGQALLDAARHRVFPIESKMAQCLTDAQRSELAELLRLCLQAIDE